MSIVDTQQGLPATGVVGVVYRDPDTPADTVAIVQVAANSGSAPSGSWETIATISPCDTAGSHYIHYTPLTGDVLWYRARHEHDAYLESDWSAARSASATTLPDVQWSTKPWILGSSPLGLVMVTSASFGGFYHVTASLNAPLFGASSTAPTISVISSQSVGLIVTGSTSGSFKVAQLASASNPSVTFRSQLTGYLDGFDLLSFPVSTTVGLNDVINIDATILSTPATASIFSVSASNGSGAPIGLGFDTVISSSITTLTAWNGSTGLYAARRPTGSNDGYIVVRASSSVTYDTDGLVITRQALSGSQYLKVIPTITGSTSTHLHYSCSVSNNTTGAPIGFGCSDATLGATITRTSTYGFAIGRPSSGVASVKFAVSSSDASIVPDYKTESIPSDASGSLPALVLDLILVSDTTSSVTYSSSWFDPSGVASGSYSARAEPVNRFNYSYLGSNLWRVDKPPFTTGSYGQFSVTVNAAGRIPASDTVSIYEGVDNLIGLKIDARVLADSGSYLVVTASCADPLDQFPVTQNVSIQPLGAVTYSSPSGGLYLVNKPVRGQGAARLAIEATAFNRQKDFEYVTIYEREGTQRPSRFGVLSEGVGAGNYAIRFLNIGWSSSAQTQSAALWRGSDNVQSSSLSPLSPTYSPYVVITPLVDGGTPVYYRPQANSGSLPVQSEYQVQFTPDPTLSYGVKIVGNSDTYNESAEQFTQGIGGTGTGSGSAGVTPFVVTEIKNLSDTVFNYLTFTISDPDNTINRLVPNPIVAYTRTGPTGRTGPYNPFSAPASGTINGTYQFQTALSDVLTHIDIIVTLADSTTVGLGPFVLDPAFYAIIDPKVSYAATASIATIYGTTKNAVTGSNLFYRVLGSGAPWSTGSIDAFQRFSINVSQSLTSVQQYQLNAANANGAMNPTDFIIGVDPWSNRYSYDTSLSESLSSGSLVVNVRDYGSVIHTTNRVKFLYASGGVPSLFNASAAPAGSNTSGQYVFDFPLHPDNNTTVQPLVYLVGGTSESLEAYAFDSDKRPNVWNLQTYTSASRGFIVAQVDSDAGTGANKLGYVVTGSSEQFLTVPANRVVSWSLGATTVGQDIQVRAYDPSGVAGPYTSGLIPPLLVQSSTGSSFTPVTLNVFPVDTATQTSVTFTSNGTVQYYVSGVLQNSGNPPSSPHIFARPTDTNPRNVTYVATHATSGDVRSVNFLVMPQVQATGSDNFPLTIQARVIPKGQFDATVQFYVADPVAQSGQDVTLTYTLSNAYGSGSPSSPITLASANVTNAISTTNAIAQIDVPLNPVASGTFTVSAVATRANRQPAAASIVVGEQKRGLYEYTVRTQYVVPQASSLEVVFSVQKYVSGSGYQNVTPSSTVDTVSLQYVKDLTGANLVANASMSYNPSTTYWSAFYTGPITDKRPYTFGVRVANTDPTWPALERSGIAAHLDQTVTYIS